MPRTRTFIGLDVGDDVRARATALQADLAATGAEVKWVEPHNLHLTLLFLGEVDDRELVDVCRIVSTATRREPPFSLRVCGVGAFPNPRRPKIVWGGITDGADNLLRLHAALEAPLLELGAYRREERAYTPHLTLGRTKSDADGNLLAPVLPKLSAWDGGQATIDEVIVYASDFEAVRQRGPTYTVVGRGPLTG